MMPILPQTQIARCSDSSDSDSDSYSFSFNLKSQRYTRAFAPLIRNVRIPGLMFLLVLCGRRFCLAKSQSEFSDSRRGGDMLDMLISEELFSRDGRNDGVTLDTLITEELFRSVEPVDMIDTFARYKSLLCLTCASDESSFRGVFLNSIISKPRFKECNYGCRL